MTEPAKDPYSSPTQPLVIGHVGHAENDIFTGGGVDASFDYASSP